MARRATTSTKKQSRDTTQSAAPTKTPRRGAKGKRDEQTETEGSIADVFFPGGDVEEVGATSPGSPEPAKVRRGRKPKSQPLPDTPTLDAIRSSEVSQPLAEPQLVENHEQPDTEVSSAVLPTEAPPRKRRGRQQQKMAEPTPEGAGHPVTPPTRAASAARWDAETGTATFDWPSIEQVAATDGPNQAMAKLLLAARAEGANSRWPF